MNTYRVTWEIDIEADTPEEAALQAREYQIMPDSCATCFTVTDRDTGKETPVDLWGPQ